MHYVYIFLINIFCGSLPSNTILSTFCKTEYQTNICISERHTINHIMIRLYLLAIYLSMNLN